MSEDLTARIEAFGSYAYWRINPIEGKPVEIYQRIPQICDPATDVIPYLKRVFDATREGRIPSELKGLNWTAGPQEFHWVNSHKDPFILTMLRFWWECTNKKPRGRPAYEWEIWITAMGLEGAFRRFDTEGRVVAIHDITRRPIDEVAESLNATQALRELSMSL